MARSRSKGAQASQSLRLVALCGGASESIRPAGKVWLVGAGPGDPDLLTLRAAAAITAADVVVYDRLVGADILALVPASARRLYVGKRKSRHALPQADVNHLLVALACEGLQVVRLKGGDPYLFGRGGEELLACRAAGVACEAVPGVSAALAAAATSGTPLTHRGLAQSVTFITGHAAPGPDGALSAPDLDWPSLARSNHTLAVYMGLSNAGWIADQLMAAGRAPSTPVVVVENASLPNERRVASPLGRLGEAVADLEGPAIFIIGEVAALAEAVQMEGGADAGALAGLSSLRSVS